MTSAIPRVDVLGVGVSAVNMETALQEIQRWIEDREEHYVCVTGVHGVMESQTDPELRAIHNRSGLTIPDGMPMVWAGHYAGFREMSQVAGPDLMPELCALAAREGWRCYFYGGAEGVPELLASKLGELFPGLQVAGTYSPPFRPLTSAEEAEVIEVIRATRPDILWIGLSTPKQERLMDVFAGRTGVPATFGVGAAFDINAGLSKRGPRWMQNIGMEWLYRMLKEPRRLARRYLVNNPRFAWAVLRRRPRPFVGPAS